MSSGHVKPRGSSANIFINYRREDSSGHAGRLFDALSSSFAGRLFMDIDTLEPGIDFVEAIEQAVGSCDVMTAIIGREWLTLEDKAGRRRLDNPDDFVRLEIESALDRKVRVIPVLVQNTPMPRSDELPGSLGRLARLNAIEISDARWAYDVGLLTRTIDEILKEKAIPVPPTAAKLKMATPRLASVNPTILWRIVAVLLVLWLLGFFAFHVAGSLIHILLVIAVIVIVVRLIQGRRVI